MIESAWMIEARKHIGKREVPGPGVNAWIKDLWHGLPGGKWFWNHYGQDDSKLPWCGAFVAGCLKAAGATTPQRYSSALAWLDWGVRLQHPTVGCVVIFKRAGGGHVGFVAGRNQRGQLLVLGGNQNDAVSIAPFAEDRIVGYRWPTGAPLPPVFAMPVLAINSALSTNEA